MKSKNKRKSQYVYSTTQSIANVLFVGFEVFIEMLLRNHDFWDVTLCFGCVVPDILKNYFTFIFRIRQFKMTLKMKSVESFNMLGTTHSLTWCCILQDLNFPSFNCLVRKMLKQWRKLWFYSPLKCYIW